MALSEPIKSIVALNEPIKSILALRGIRQNCWVAVLHTPFDISQSLFQLESCQDATPKGRISQCEDRVLKGVSVTFLLS